MDYLLRFINKAAADEALFVEETVLIDDVYKIVLRPKYTAVDVIGTIYKPTGNFTGEDEFRVPEMLALTGYYVNVRNDLDAPELVKYLIIADTPERIWA
jgi:hypothetical protein